jgi:sulfur carrier protein ThiS
MLLMDYSTPLHAPRRRRESASLILHETTALECDHGSTMQETTALEEVHDLIIPERTALAEVNDSIVPETIVSAEVQDDSSLQLELLPRLMPMGHH